MLTDLKAEKYNYRIFGKSFLYFQVFIYAAQKLNAEGSEKTWDQCRIKLKNLKSNLRYVKERIPNIDEIDLEDEDTLKQLVQESQSRGISPSNIRHLKYLKRFLLKYNNVASTILQNAPSITSPNLSRPSRLEKSLISTDSEG